ncbi:MAG: 4Fe-4S binding protein [Desulfurococcaceae archaeon]|nr:4Fe-4S binding protein [Desulfurococcaceae archaeon]
MTHFKESGVVDLDTLARMGYVPSEERLRRGPVAIYECVEEIPCNVCVFSCPFNAVTKNKITDLPKIDFSKCTGCGVCVGRCPGLAIFVVDVSREGDVGYVTLPHELLPAPSKGSEVLLLDREGREVGRGTVTKVYRDKITRSWVVTLSVPKDLVMVVRAIRVIK